MVYIGVPLFWQTTTTQDLVTLEDEVSTVSIWFSMFLLIWLSMIVGNIPMASLPRHTGINTYIYIYVHIYIHIYIYISLSTLIIQALKIPTRKSRPAPLFSLSAILGLSLAPWAIRWSSWGGQCAAEQGLKGGYYVTLLPQECRIQWKRTWKMNWKLLWAIVWTP